MASLSCVVVMEVPLGLVSDRRGMKPWWQEGDGLANKAVLWGYLS